MARALSGNEAVTRDLSPGAMDRLESIAREEGPPPDVGRYRVVREIGRGAMGAVYEAQDTQLGRRVALKVLRALGADLRTRFEREARAMAQVAHPNVVTVYDAGEAGGHPYIGMEFVDGRPLSALLTARRDALPDLLHLLADTARGVHAAHAAGIIHRDLKPSNILVAGTTAKVADFGIARAADDGTGLTRTGASMGTPSYMAPEQAAGLTSQIGPATDVYALGAILYEVLTGRCPHSGATAAEILHRILTEDPAAPRSLNAGVPAALQAVCMKAIEKKPARRFASAAEFAGDLERYLRGEPVLARPPGLGAVATRFVRRRPTLLAVAVVLAISAAATTWIVLAGKADRARRIAVLVESCGRAQEARSGALSKLDALAAQRDAMAARMEPSAPPLEKQPLWDLERRIGELEREAERARNDLVVAAGSALALDPACPPARAALAALHRADFAEAERARDVEAMRAAAKLVALFGGGELSLEGTVTIVSDPAGAEAVLFAYEEAPDRRLLPSKAGRALGRCPVSVTVPAGSYLVVLRAEGRRETRRPLLVRRGAERVTVRLLADAEIGEGFVHVPAGPFVSGTGLGRTAELPDFCIARREVTCGEYLQFLNDRKFQTLEQALVRVPRRARQPQGGSAATGSRRAPSRSTCRSSGSRGTTRWDTPSGARGRTRTRRTACRHRWNGRRRRAASTAGSIRGAAGSTGPSPSGACRGRSSAAPPRWGARRRTKAPTACSTSRATCASSATKTRERARRSCTGEGGRPR